MYFALSVFTFLLLLFHTFFSLFVVTYCLAIFFFSRSNGESNNDSKKVSKINTKMSEQLPQRLCVVMTVKTRKCCNWRNILQLTINKRNTYNLITESDSLSHFCRFVFIPSHLLFYELCSSFFFHCGNVWSDGYIPSNIVCFDCARKWHVHRNECADCWIAYNYCNLLCYFDCVRVCVCNELLVVGAFKLDYISFFLCACVPICWGIYRNSLLDFIFI